LLWASDTICPWPTICRLMHICADMELHERDTKIYPSALIVCRPPTSMLRRV
jgi:hypothetical protein